MPLNTVASKSHEVSGQTKMEDCRIESTDVERTGDFGKGISLTKRDGVVTLECIDDAMQVESRTASERMGFAKQQRMIVKTQEEGLRLAENGRHPQSPVSKSGPILVCTLYSGVAHCKIGAAGGVGRFSNSPLSKYFAGY